MSSHHHHHHAHDLTTIRGRAELFVHRALRPWRKLSQKSKVTVWIVAGLHVVAIIALLIITPRRIAEWFHSLAVGVKDMGWKGSVLLMLCVIAASHPPLFGFSASMSMIGFSYGLGQGMVIGGIASLMGAALAWFSIRTFFLNWMRKFGSSNNKQWEAFGHVMREKGWPLVAMIRWCPLPWAIGNGLFASIEGVEFWHFMLANALYIPRLAIPIFIGSRLGSLTGVDDGAGEDGDKKPDPVKFWLNLISIGVSIFVSIGTGVLIYRLTLDQMRKLESCPPGEGDLAVEALEATALLGDYSDEEVQEELVPRLGSQQSGRTPEAIELV